MLQYTGCVVYSKVFHVLNMIDLLNGLMGIFLLFGYLVCGLFAHMLDWRPVNGVMERQLPVSINEVIVSWCWRPTGKTYQNDIGLAPLSGLIVYRIEPHKMAR